MEEVYDDVIIKDFINDFFFDSIVFLRFFGVRKSFIVLVDIDNRNLERN